MQFLASYGTKTRPRTPLAKSLIVNRGEYNWRSLVWPIVVAQHVPFACALFVSENRFNNCDPILSQENLGPRSSDIAYGKPTIGNKKNYPKSRNATEPAFLNHSSRHANPYPRPLCILSPYSKGQLLTAELRPRREVFHPSPPSLLSSIIRSTTSPTHTMGVTTSAVSLIGATCASAGVPSVSLGLGSPKSWMTTIGT